MTFLDLWHVCKFIFFPTLLFITIISAFIILFVKILFQIEIKKYGLLLISFGFLGGVLGVASGASESPVMSAVLPALLTLVTGLLGHLFSKEHLKEWRPIIPCCIISLLLTALFGLFAGASIVKSQEEFIRNYEKRLLLYKNVELEVEKQKQLKKLNNNDKKTMNTK